MSPSPTAARSAPRAVILATGATYHRLGVPELEALVGAGVFYSGPASEAPTTVDEEVYVVGGANSAGQAALHLAEFARRVTLVVRADSLEKGMSHYLVRQVEGAPNIDVRLGTEVVGGGAGGDGWLERLVLRSRADGTTETVAADELFLLIGARPNTEWLSAACTLGDGGFIRTGADIENDGILAARAQPVLARDEHARRLRGGRRPSRLDEPGRLGGRRGLDRDQAHPRALRRRAELRNTHMVEGMDEPLSRYLAASEAGDIEGVIGALAADVELTSPISGRMVFRGREDVGFLLGAVYGSLKDLHWTQTLGEGENRVSVGHARIGPLRMTDAMVFELDSAGRIRMISPHLRPWLALTLFALVLGPKVARRPGVLWRALRG